MELTPPALAEEESRPKIIIRTVKAARKNNRIVAKPYCKKAKKLDEVVCVFLIFICFS
jgi:hypothetical protein